MEMSDRLSIRQASFRVALACTSLAVTAGAFADDSISVTPYRPSVSTPAALSAPGWLEVEAGIQRSHAEDPKRRDSLPYTLKFAFTPDWGIRIGGDAVVREVGLDGSRTRGVGDTTLVLKRRFAVSDECAFGMELGAKIPTARTALGSGRTDIDINGIYSVDFADTWHADVNALATHIGGVDSGVNHWQLGWAAALSRSVSDRWGVVGELSGTHQGGLANTTQALVAVSYSVSKSVTLDLGTSKGLNTASGGWSVFSGITFLAARLF